MVNLQRGDCLEIMKNIPDKSIDMVLTSPPYDNIRLYDGVIEQWNFEKFQQIAKQLYRVLNDGGVLVWIVNDATISNHKDRIWEQRIFTENQRARHKQGAQRFR